MSPRSHSITRTLASAAIFLVALVSCSAGQDSTDGFTGPYGSEFKDAYEAATDPGVKAALEDGKISRAEYHDAYQRFVTCAKDRGVAVALKEEYGLYTYSTARGSSEEATVNACSAQVQNIAMLYAGVLTNPQNQDPMDVTAECLRKSGLVSRDYTGKKLLADSDGGTLPFNMDDPSAARCLTNPQANG